MHGKLVVSTLAAAAVLLLAPAAQAGQVQTLTLGTNPAEVAFDSHVTYDSAGNPTYHPTYDDQTIWNQLAGMIRRADPGSAIGLSVYDTDASSSVVSDAVRYVTNSANKNPPVQVWVVDDHYDQNAPPGQHYQVCAVLLAHHGCLSNNIDGRQHAKYAVFTSTHDAHGGPSTKAAWVSSANLESRTGQEEYNNAIAFYGNATTGSNQMYDGLQKVFSDQWADTQSSPDYFDQASGQGYFGTSDSSAVVSVSPEQQTNLWYEQIHPLNVVPGCTVRVMQAEFGDGMLDDVNNPADELARLYKAGCSVAVIVHQRDDGYSVLWEKDSNGVYQKTTTWHRLCDAGVPVRSIPLVHDKIVFEGPKYNGYDNNWQVMMGSTNFSKGSTHLNDEVLVRVHGSKPLYDLYNTHWWEAWAYARNECNAAPTG